MALAIGVTIKVEGMTCSHCEANVKRNLETLKGVRSVVANNQTNTVKVTGSKFDLNKIEETINGLGYKFIG